MLKRIISLLAAIMIFSLSAFQYSFADEKGKVIFINMSRTSLENMTSIHVIGDRLENEGYVGLMNIKGDQGNDDARSLSSMGATGRAAVGEFNEKQVSSFVNPTEKEKMIFESSTGKKAKEVINAGINVSSNENVEKGEFESTLGIVGQVMNENGLTTAVLGNSDTYNMSGDIYEKNRAIGFVAMDKYGRVDAGNVDNINKSDMNMPYGVSTDYVKLKKETEEMYKNHDAVFVDLGDTYRLDEYKPNLTEETYVSMRAKIYSRINNYLEYVFSMVNDNDTVYIVSAFPSNLDYTNKRRLSPVIKFDGEEGSGVLSSATTRREGIIANIDLGVDILDTFGLSNDEMLGRTLSEVQMDNGTEYLLNEYAKINSAALIRAGVVNGFVGVVSASWVIGLIAVLMYKRIPDKYRDGLLKVLRELIKFGIIMPLSFLVAPLLGFSTPISMSIGVIAVALLIYAVSRAIFKKNDLAQMGFVALITITLIAIDSVMGTFLMENNIMSYDAMVGARYYGIGNEYEGVTIGSAVFAFAILLYHKKLSKVAVAILSLVVLVTSAHPSMGANVGGAISESVAYLLFVLLIFNVKIDWKKVIGLGIAAALVVGVFAYIDLSSGSPSHLGLFVQQIMINGPSEIVLTFTRKIEMNMQLAQTSVWVNILLVGMAVIAAFIFKPTRHFKIIADKYPIIFKGFVASMVGCIVTLLVNDSGIVAASTASIYILIPIMVISINMLFEKEKRDADR